jgi:hypothetical protein
LFGGVFKRHWILVVEVIVFGICLWLVLRLRRQAEKAEEE